MTDGRVEELRQQLEKQQAALAAFQPVETRLKTSCK